MSELKPLTDNEIIKALEAWLEEETDRYQTRLYVGGEINEETELFFEFMQEIVSFINRQKEEIDRLREKNKRLFAENVGITHSSKEIKAEAIKGFADKIKDKFDKHGIDYTAYAIVDDVLKETVGEDK